MNFPTRGFISNLLPYFAFILFLGLWEVGVRIFYVNPGILPAFSAVLVEIGVSKSLLFSHLSLTLIEIILGFVLSFLVAALLAIMFDGIRILRSALYPVLISLQSIPKIALAPILVIWLGYGILPNIVMATLIAIFPLLINFVAGLDSTSEELELFFDSLAATWRQRLLKARLPSAVPYILNGCKISITYATIGAIVGEFSNPSCGLGYIIDIAEENFDSSLQFAAIFIVSIMGWILFRFVTLVENFFFQRYLLGRGKAGMDMSSRAL